MNEQPTTPRDDTEGHAYKSGRDTLGGPGPKHPKADDLDDVSGHLSGALGSKKKGDGDEGRGARGNF